jgi:acetyl-CoA synthetase
VALTYEAWRDGFRWEIPERFNIAAACCDRWADGSGRVALIHLRQDGGLESISFDELRRRTARLANTLAAHGIKRGDRVAVLLPQVPETAVAHLAAYRIGAIAVPLFQLFGEEALEYRLRDCGATAIVTDAAGLAKLDPIRERLPDLRLVLSADRAGPGALDLHAEMARASDAHECLDTAAEDPALIIYTSGTTGPAKGALHAHRVLLGHLPGVEMPQDLFPQRGDLFWTPADWAWIGGLLDVLLPSLFHGVPVLAHRMVKFDPEIALALMARHGVRNAFLPPTALKMLRQVPEAARFGARPRSVGSGGESLGGELLDWGRAALGVTINEFYGQTECNLTLSSCGSLFAPRPGWIGKPVPGHVVDVIEGEICVKAPDPVMFLRYWNKPEATAAKFRNGWLRTGDMGERDGDWFRFTGRDDDVITSAGYRIGPAEIEECLMRHPAVAMAAVVGVPDPLRTERVTAVVVPTLGTAPTPALAAELQLHVKARLAAHLYPREVRFADALPQTATGKIMRRQIRQELAAEEAKN